MSLAKVAYLNLGCRVNRVELDSIAAELAEAGVLSADAADANVIVINTCAVTGEAQAKTRKAVRHALALPAAPQVIATGCAATLFADELRELGERVVVEPRKDQVATRARELLAQSPQVDAADTASEQVSSSVTPTGRTRPGIKVQDGCDRRCSYCIVWKARGQARSVAPAEVRAQMERECALGAHEVVLTGINLGAYNSDGLDLAGLLDYLLTTTGVARIRLSSIEPPDVGERLLSIMSAAGDRVAPYLHIPLQSGSDEILKRMGRPYTASDYAACIQQVRTALPGCAVGCDVIVGFPGETDATFEESLAFCRGLHFAHMHVFRYSARPGTPAASMNDQIVPATKAARAARMRELAQQGFLEAARARLGTTEQIVVQSPGQGVTGGLFDALVDEDIEVGALVERPCVGVSTSGVLDCRRAPSASR